RPFCPRSGNLLREKRHDIVDAVRAKRLAIVVRHEGLFVKGDLLQVRFIEHMQMTFGIDYLDGVIGIISGYALDFSSIFLNDRYRLEADMRRGVGIDDALAQLFGSQSRSSVGEIGPEDAAESPDGVTIAAMRASVIKLAPGLGISGDRILGD